jgi:hypothetical protein
MRLAVIKLVECSHFTVIGEGKGIVRAKYEAPPPTLEDSPRETVYLFVPEDEQAASSWSFSSYPWLDSPKVEGAWCERCVFCQFGLRIKRTSAETLFL